MDRNLINMTITMTKEIKAHSAGKGYIGFSAYPKLDCRENGRKEELIPRTCRYEGKSAKA